VTVPQSATAPAGQPTLEQVAALAGVSRATVSRVVNGSPRVSPERRALVEQAIGKLGYVPNRAARSLVTRRSDSVALVVFEPEARVFAEPFFAGMARGVASALAATDLQLVLLMAQDPAQRERVVRYIVNHHADGVLLASLHGEDPLPRRLADAGVPTVLMGRPAGRVAASYVDADNRGGAREAVAYLAANGRQRIATITGTQDLSVGRDRLDGYQDALRAAGLPVDMRLVEPGDFSEESGHRAMAALLDREPDLDAVFAASDLMALGAMRVLKDTGRKVPEQVAVVGFDDSVLARHAEPQLTTVRQPVEEMGRQMTRLLLAKLAGEAVGVSVILETELVVRASA
jgi:DNA-binding LacI/PurR family transcriptional regulator